MSEITLERAPKGWSQVSSLRSQLKVFQRGLEALYRVEALHEQHFEMVLARDENHALIGYLLFKHGVNPYYLLEANGPSAKEANRELTEERHSLQAENYASYYSLRPNALIEQFPLLNPIPSAEIWLELDFDKLDHEEEARGLARHLSERFEGFVAFYDRPLQMWTSSYPDGFEILGKVVLPARGVDKVKHLLREEQWTLKVDGLRLHTSFDSQLRVQSAMISAGLKPR